ncbi:MAG: tRNA (N6-isopentenyl adenosine(37)-C2)-methylthiotransferase MiaB [Acidobacteriota bacterium]
MSPLNILTSEVSLQPATQPRRYYIETWGCQMNELDTQRMAGQLMEQGLLPTRQPEEADLILLNSCSVREKAENKVYSRLGEYRLFKRDRPDLLIGLCGCVAQQVGKRALSKVPDLDFVLGPARVGELKEILDQRRSGERVVATGFPDERDYEFDTIARDGLHKGMVTIIEGCNKRCTFCIVPSTRGPERCRPFQEVLDEVRHLVDFGFVEIELLGQTVNHWKDPDSDLDFADLLDAVAQIDGVQRLRFVTSYPRDFTPAMVAQLGKHENIAPYLHLPVQAGSNRTLQRMGRGHKIEPYRELVAQIRAARPDITLSTDLIVGFPGETQEEFEETLALVEEIRYGSIYAFKYSPRPGTAAPRLKEAVDEKAASANLQRLFEVQHQISLELNQEKVGENIDVLVTGWSNGGQNLQGRTPCHRVVHFPPPSPGHADAAPGNIIPVRIHRAGPHSLKGLPLDERGEVASQVSQRLPILAG